MPNWENSDRRSRLPADWPAIRVRILRRDSYRCTNRNAAGRRCTAEATDVDHIQHGDDHRDSNLTALCSAHHSVKSSREGAAAARARRREIHNRFREPEEDHPGAI